MGSAPPPGRFAASGRAIVDSVGFAPEISSERAGWESLALFGWRGHCEEAAFEPFDEPVIVYHVGGAQTVPVRVGRHWQSSTHPGLITIIPPATRIDWDIRGGEVHSRSIHLGSRFFSADGGEARSGSGLRFRCGVQDPLLTSAIEALERELRTPREHGTLYADSVSDLMALHLLRDTGHPIALSQRRGTLPAKALQRVLDRIEASIEHGISLQALADEAALSRSYFSSAFRASTGVTPHRYLTQRRLAHARDLLRTTAISLADVALRCGFSSQAHFTQYFHRENGVTPSQFRQA